MIPKPPKVGKIMAQNHKKAIILHTFGVQVTVMIFYLDADLNPSAV